MQRNFQRKYETVYCIITIIVIENILLFDCIQQISVRVRRDILSAPRSARGNVGKRHGAHNNGVYGRKIRGDLSSVHGSEHVETLQSSETDLRHMAGGRAVCHTAGECF